MLRWEKEKKSRQFRHKNQEILWEKHIAQENHIVVNNEKPTTIWASQRKIAKNVTVNKPAILLLVLVLALL